MTFERLGPIVERVVSRLVNDAGGDGDGCNRPDAHNLGNAKGRPVHHKAPPQRRTGQPLTLFVIEGGRPARGGGSSRAAYAQAGGGNPASNLKLVVG
jgi:hypothetical protein